MTAETTAATIIDMRLFSDSPSPTLAPAKPKPKPKPKPKLTPAERRARQADRLTTIRLRMAIWHELEDRGITKAAEIGAALGMPTAEATSLLTRHQWREGDVALLQAVVRGYAGVPGRGSAALLTAVDGMIEDAAYLGRHEPVPWPAPCRP